jgi:hypothetical protein
VRRLYPRVLGVGAPIVELLYFLQWFSSRDGPKRSLLTLEKHETKLKTTLKHIETNQRFHVTEHLLSLFVAKVLTHFQGDQRCVCRHEAEEL